jgi:FkbM family methyltransferase
MAIRRVAVIFDNRVRPDTTGVYCRRALGQLVEVDHFLPSELDRIPRQGFDLYLNIDDGLGYAFPGDLRPCAWWAIDTHLNFEAYLPRARGFDFVFSAQREGSDRFRAAGLESASWLPLACDPDFHRRHALPKLYDVAFVGNVFAGPRAELLEQIQRRYPNSFVGKCFFEEMAKTYSQARVVFNRSVLNDINMRVFEALACGSLLVTNNLANYGQEDLFQDGVHLATYQDSGDLLDKIAFYLKREDVRDKIAAAGREEALAWHTYRQRMEKVLRDVEAGLSICKVRVESTVRPKRPATVLDLVPDAARSVLDLGCGEGARAAALRSRRAVFGIEADPRDADQARQRLDRVWAADVEQLDRAFAVARFDVALAVDVVQTWKDPLETLRRVRNWLEPTGRLICQIANARHHPFVQALLAGHCTYGIGALNGRQRRLFTRREIEKLLFRAGFSIQEIHPVPGSGFAEWEAGGRRGTVTVGGLSVSGMPVEEAEEFYTEAYLIAAEPLPPPNWGLTSIVVVTHNELPYTRQCLESLRNFTDEPYELIVVDNGSTDETRAYLQTLPDVKLITNSDNRGFPAAANQGIQAAAGRQVLLLNNDCLVTTGWLARLLRALYSDARVGLAGPCSNLVSGEQQIEVTYGTLEELDGFSWEWARTHAHKIQDTDRLVGFCLLIRRELIEQIGLLDERFGIGCFEDDDFTLRACRAGCRAVIAQDAFVHHFGGRTFIGAKIDFAALMQANQRRFEEKWQPAAATANIASPEQTKRGPIFELHRDSAGGLLLRKREPAISLCMIVRDNARTLRSSLESIRPWVDEMIVIDTGSTDDTPKIAQDMGARVYHFPWCDSFSAARNESLRHARGRWIFWMDSDDTIDAANGGRLQELGRRDTDPGVLGYVMQVHCPGAGRDGRGDMTVVDHVKLFRNRPDMRFDGRIHEQILPAIGAAGGEVVFTDIFVVHSGYDHSPEGQKRKLERDLHLLNLELSERPNHPFTLFNFGMTYTDVGRYEEACDSLKRSIAHSGCMDSHLRKAYALLVYCQLQGGQREAAEETCRRGLELFPTDVELRFRRALILQESGQLDQAAAIYRSVLEPQKERYFSSLVRGITGYLTRQNLAVVYQEQGDLDKAKTEWRHITEEVPDYRAGWRGLGDVLLLRREFDQALALADQMLSKPALRSEWRLLRGQVLSAQGRFSEARAEFEAAVAESPEDQEAADALCRFLFDQGDLAEAERRLVALARQEAGNGAACHNLGTVFLRQGRHQEAVDWYRESIKRRPGNAPSYAQLGHALRALGQTQEAESALQEAVRLAPNDAAALGALQEVQREQTSLPTKTTIHSIACRTATRRLRLPGRVKDIVFATRGAVDEAILREVWEQDVYGTRALKKPPSIVLDIGAHIGIFAVLARQLWPKARIIACEPDPDNCALLCQNLRDHDRVEVVEAAVVDQDATEIDFYSVPDKATQNSGGGSCLPGRGGACLIRVAAVSAVQLWQLKKINRCDFLKLDCEGFECAVLSSLAEAKLLTRIGRIAGEWHSVSNAAESVAEVQRSLQATLDSTHTVVFQPESKGREGYFLAMPKNPRRRRP